MNHRTSEKSKFHYAFRIVLCCCAFSATCVASTFGCAGLFYTPVSTELGVSTGTFAVYMTIMSLVVGLFSPFAGRLVERYSIRRLITLSVLLQIVCFAAQSQFTAVYQFYITGALMGLVQTFVYLLASPVLIDRWFKVRMGFFVGLSSSVSGLAGILLNPLAGKILEAYGWRAAYLFFAALIAVVALPASVFVLQDRPSDVGLKPYGEAEECAAGPKEQADSLTGVPYEKAVHSSVFVLLAITAVIITLYSNFPTYLPSYAASLGLSIVYGSSLSGAAQIGNLVGKNMIGLVYDKNPVAAVLIGNLTVTAGLILLLIFHSGGVPMLAAAAIFGMIYAVPAVLNPLVVRTAFGARDYSRIYGRIAFFASTVGAFGTAAWGYLVDRMGGSYTPVLLLCVGMTGMSCLFGLLALKSGQKLRVSEECI